MQTQAANRLMELREAKGLLRSQVAAELRVDQSTVYRWETGRSSIPDPAKSQLAEMFGVTRAYLMAWDEDGVA